MRLPPPINILESYLENLFDRSVGLRLFSANVSMSGVHCHAREDTSLPMLGRRAAVCYIVSVDGSSDIRPVLHTLRESGQKHRRSNTDQVQPTEQFEVIREVDSALEVVSTTKAAVHLLLH